MASVTTDVPITRWGTQDGHQPMAFPEKASQSIYAGTIAVTDSTGYAKDAASSPATTDVCWGLYNGQYDSQEHISAPMAGGTTNGLHIVGVDTGTFLLNNAPGPDAIAQANLGAVCYIFDNVTVSLTNSTGSRAVAGTVMGIVATSASPLTSQGTAGFYTGKVAVKLGSKASALQVNQGPNTGSP